VLPPKHELTSMCLVKMPPQLTAWVYDHVRLFFSTLFRMKEPTRCLCTIRSVNLEMRMKDEICRGFAWASGVETCRSPVLRFMLADISDLCCKQPNYIYRRVAREIKTVLMSCWATTVAHFCAKYNARWYVKLCLYHGGKSITYMMYSE